MTTDATKEDIQKSLLPRVDHLTYRHVKPEPIIAQVAKVLRGPDKKERPVRIDFEPNPRCIDPIEGKPLHYLPCKGMRIVLAEIWGLDGAVEWIGKSMELFGNPDVMYGGKKEGGIQISRLSHIKQPVTVMLTVRRGVKEPFRIEPLPVVNQTPKPELSRVEWFRGWLGKKELPETEALEQIGGRPLEEATDEDWAALKVWMQQFTKKATDDPSK